MARVPCQLPNSALSLGCRQGCRQEGKVYPTYTVLVLLDLDGRSVFKGPSVHVGIGAGVRHLLGLVESSPEFVEVAELDEVPDVGERGSEDSADADFVGGGSRHYGDCLGFGIGSFVCSGQANGPILGVDG